MVALFPEFYGPIRTEDPGCVGPRRLRSPPLNRAARSRRPGSAWTAVSSLSRLGRWAINCRAAEWCQCRHSHEGLIHPTSVKH